MAGDVHFPWTCRHAQCYAKHWGGVGMSTLFRCYAKPFEFVSALKDAILTVWKDVLQRHAWKMMQIAPKKVVFRAPFKTSKTLSWPRPKTIEEWTCDSARRSPQLEPRPSTQHRPCSFPGPALSFYDHWPPSSRELFSYPLFRFSFQAPSTCLV